MSHGQHHNNRSQGQRIRRAKEIQSELIDVVSKNTTDIAALQAKVAYLESELERIAEEMSADGIPNAEIISIFRRSA